MANDNQKTWSYAEITRATEERIKLAKRTADKLKHIEDKRWQETLAFGIYIAWDTITSIYQESGDKERLEKLTEFT